MTKNLRMHGRRGGGGSLPRPPVYCPFLRLHRNVQQHPVLGQNAPGLAEADEAAHRPALRTSTRQKAGVTKQFIKLG